MYLKQLEVRNFKSFKGEVTIPLEQGFTAITGPNGSGKSNCGDAIQFVLGPRSTKVLRAGNVKDLIFNGGAKDKPARECEVTLVFSNPVMPDGSRRMAYDSDEVKMTRSVRLTSSNNTVSEYTLNGEESNRSTFRRLLSSANARPDGYNIVLQGDVASLSKMSTRERRKVLDDVAGVTSYDDEIKKAGKQRVKVEEYIERIQLIEDEQKQRLSELSKEKKQAVKAKDLKDSLDSARTLLQQVRYATVKGEIQYHNEEKVRQLEKANSLDEEVKSGSKKLLELDDQVSEIEKKVREQMGEGGEELLESINALKITIATSGDKISDANKIIVENEEKLEQAKQELLDAHQELESFVNDFSSSNESLAKAKESLKAANEKRDKLNEKLQSSSSALSRLAEDEKNASESVESARKALNLAQSEVDTGAGQAEAIVSQLAEAESRFDEAKISVGELELVGEDLKEQQAGNDREKLAAELMSANKEEALLKEELGAVERKLSQTTQRLASARAEMESKSGAKGLAGGAAAVLRARDSGELKGVIGTIAELCAPKDQSLEVALATAIGGGMASVVVDNDQYAEDAIKWLSRNNAGRATFLPLNKLSSTRAAGKAVMVARKPGVIGFAHDLLDYDPRIDIAVKFALRNTLIVENLSVARQNMGGVRLVTKNGDVTEAGGAMVGGSRRKMNITFGGKIQGASEVEKCQAEVNRLQGMQSRVQESIEAARAKQSRIKSQLNEAGEDSLTQKIADWRAEIKSAKFKMSQAQGDVAKVERQLSDLQLQAKGKLSALTYAEKSLEQAEQNHESAKNALQEASPVHLKEQMSAVELEIVTAKSEISRIGEMQSSADKQKLLLQKAAESSQIKLADIESSISDNKSLIVELEEQIASNKVDLDAKENERSILMESNQELEDERNDLIEKRATLRASLEQKSENSRQMRSMASSIEATLGSKKVELDNIFTEMFEEGISPAEEDADLPNLNEVERSVRNLDKKMAALGPVNFLALEQYEACENRLNDMKDDFKSLQSRRKELIEVTELLESQRTERITSVLSEVNKNFKEVYKILSNGGEGELFFDNPDNPFQGGLDMWARPRGKSSKCSLAGLSGGEQSVAALALIFAIQDYDPSPFYYFDEVDQNLDGDNSYRIADMCRQRSKQAQFIMVTLRKVSLGLADHHIGITHGGDGCSRRIMDFDRERAIQVGEEARIEQEAAMKQNKILSSESQAFQDAMPSVPEELDTPISLGGSNSFEGLAERTEEMTEDIEERQAVSSEILAMEQSSQEDDVSSEQVEVE